ncbi:M48 family peptidase [Mariniphaga sediminis]|uniref:M48 family peptidase n=1 Tax=Mariniphaga sediminis TaxID=1628158 RepID=A0A399CY72_9BACT|nr:M48 family metallopeptidase [Mariniphaga sediminis]RIH63432.1 M48 family peptidase [Mariniphaga sediminis]
MKTLAKKWIKRVGFQVRKPLLLVLGSVLFTGCVLNLVTGRNQLSLVPESELQLMATSQYSAFLAEHKVLSPGNKEAAMVDHVGARISNAITKYYNSQGQQSVIEGYKWEFNTVDDKAVNAWCMPGGKVVVYTGLLPVTQTETALAIVVGHEIAHAIAKHGSERMSQGMIQQLGGVALQVALSQKPQETQNLFMQAYGIGSTVGAVLPWSRQQETEADQYGLIFAAMAGYNPQEAIPFWERMSNAGGAKPPEFLSTHPSDETRIRKLKQFMPEAMKYYNQSK